MSLNNLTLLLHTDIDECVTGSHRCHAQATCTNTPGGHSCACNVGWTGSGTSCVGEWPCIEYRHNWKHWADTLHACANLATCMLSTREGYNHICTAVPPLMRIILWYRIIPLWMSNFGTIISFNSRSTEHVNQLQVELIFSVCSRLQCWTHCCMDEKREGEFCRICVYIYIYIFFFLHD